MRDSALSGIARFVREHRALVPFVASVGYVAAAALRAHDGAPLRPLSFGAAALAIVVLAERRNKPLRMVAWGLAVEVASLGADARGWLDAFGAFGAAVGFMTAARAVVAMQGAGGLGAARPPSARLVLALGGLGWSVALASTVLDAAGYPSVLARAPTSWVCVAAAVSSLGVLRLARVSAKVRRLDLGVVPRAHGVLALTAIAMSFSALASVIALADADRIARFAVALGSVVVAHVCLASDAVAIARASRRFVALALAAGPVVVFGMSLSRGRPYDTAAVTALTAICAVAVGAYARVFERPLRPAQGVWLDAARKAREAIERSDPDDALRDVLLALREPAGAQGATPVLLTLDPPRAMTIDAAGYAHDKELTIPEGLVAVAAREPEASLRTEVLVALEVRRPDLRPMLKWMIDRGASLAAVVTRGGEAEGLLVVPEIPRQDPLSLEEARALKGVADALAGAIQARAALGRSMERERVMRLKAEAAEDLAARLQHEVTLAEGRNALAAYRLARPATIGIYSAASRMALDATLRRVRAGAPLAVVAPSGVDPIPFIARAHVEGPRATGPLVLVDGTQSREHDVARWTDAKSSPLALAAGGLLVLLDGAALPLDVQRLIARVLSERRAPWERPEPLDVALAFTAVAAPDQLVERGLLDASLAARLGDAASEPIVLPRLADRPEDIRALLTDRLAREGLRVLGRPVGIDDAAFGRLVERTFPDEDAELLYLVQRLVAKVGSRGGDVVGPSDIPEELAPPAAEISNRELRLSKPFRP
jgi:hypothetical protein